MTYHWRAAQLDTFDPRCGYGVCLELRDVGPSRHTKRCAVRFYSRDHLPEAIQTLSAWADGWTRRFA